MILKRRIPRTRREHIREAFWPTMGFRRVLHYYKHRISRLPGTPYYIAAGFATGIAVSFTPFVGFHLAMAGVLTWLLGGSLLAMVLGTVIAGNPWTYPLIWLGTYKLGKWILGGHIIREPKTFHTQFTFSDLLDKSQELLLPMTLGSVPFAIAGWLVSYYIVRHVVTRHKEARLERIYKEKEAD